MAHLHSVSNPPSYPQYDFHSLHQSPPSHQAAFAAQPPPPPPPLPFHPSPGSHGDQQQQRSQRASRLPPFLHDHQQQPHQQRQQPDYHSHHQPRRNPYDHHPDPWSYRPENVYDRQHGLQHQQQSSYQHPPAYHRQSLDHRYFEPPFPAPQPYHSRSHYTERDYYKPSDSHHSFSQRRSYSPNMPRAAASGSSTQFAASTKSRRRPAAPMAAPSASSSRTLTTSTSSSSIAYHFEREHLPTGESREVIVLDDDSPTPPPKKRTTRATAAAADAALLAASGGGASLSSGNAAASTATSNRKRKADDGQTSGGTAKVARGAGLDRQPVASSSTYASSSSRAVVPPPPAAPPAPPSCDDAEGHYIIREGDIIYGRYKIIKKLGEGTFGKVVAAQDRSSRRMYAVKIIRAVQKYRDASKIEIRVLNELKRSDPKNVNKCIHLTECFEHLNHVCLVFELLGSSVFDFLKENNFTPFPMKHIQEFARQLLTSVGYMHKLGLVHTDLKPENILLADSSNFPQNPVANPRQNPPRLLLKNTDIRLIDFGSATFEKEYHSTVVSTRHYRAPEIILGLGWSYPCDMFSIGCILIEFFTGEALFQTHGNLEHLAMMEIVMGKMPETMLKRSIRAKPEFFKNGKLDYPNATTDRASRKFLKGMRRIDQIIPPTDVIKTRFADLIRSLLAFDPERRLKVQDALRHPFFQLVIDLD